MVVCKFYLQGNCKYGSNCWYEHPQDGFRATAQRQLFGGGRGGGGGGGGGQKVTFRDSFGTSGNQNPYKWLSSDAKTQNQQTGASSAPQGPQQSPVEILKALGSEMTTWEQAHMWPLSCVGYEKEAPSIPGFSDMSFEELRTDAYEAQKSGNTQSYVQKVATLMTDMNNKRNELKNPSLSFKQKLVSFIEDCRRKKASGSGGSTALFSGSSSSASSTGSTGLFGQSTQQSSGTFGQPSTFGQPTQQSSNTFGQPSTFGQQTQQSTSTFGQQSTFGQPATPQSTFGQQGTFGKPASTTSPFGQPAQPSTFGQGQGQASSTFGQPGGGFGQGGFGQPQTQTAAQTTQSQPQMLFGKPVASTAGASGGSSFGSSPQSSGGFGGASPQSSGGFGGASPFGQANTSTAPTGSTFGAFGQQTQGASGVQGSSSVYTPLDKLTPQELDQFKASVFTVGSIPTKPPPKELCS